MKRYVLAAVAALALMMATAVPILASHDGGPGGGQECNGLNRAPVGDEYCP